MKVFVKRWAQGVIGNRWAVIALSILLVLAFGSQLGKLKFDNSIEMWFLKGDRAVEEHRLFQNRFGDTQYLVVGIKNSQERSIINKQTFLAVGKITDFLEAHDSIHKVDSLSNYEYIRTDDDTLYNKELVEDPESYQWDEEGVSKIKKILKGEKLALGRIVTEDFEHTLISASSLYEEGKIDGDIKLVTDLENFLKKEKFSEEGIEVYLSGSPFINERFFSVSQEDQQVSFPLMFLLIILFLIICFRSLPGVLFPLALVAATVIVALGTMGAAGLSQNMVSLILPIILIVVGIADSVHIIVEFYSRRREGADPKRAAAEAIEVLFTPCLNTTLTTACGFMALSVSQLAPIKEFGWVASVGVGVAFLFSVTTLPAVLSFVKKGSVKKEKKAWSRSFAEGVTRFSHDKRKTIAALGALLLVGSLTFAVKIRADANYVESFKVGSDVRAGLEYFDQTYGGITNLEFMVDSGQGEGAKDPLFMEKLLAIQNYLESLPQVGYTNSFLNTVLQLNKVMNGGKEEMYRIPHSRNLTSQYLLLYTNSGPKNDLTDFLSFDNRYARITANLPVMPNSELAGLIDKVKERIEADYGEVPVTITGTNILTVRMNTYIQQSLIYSFSIALFIIMVGLVLFMRSFRFGCLALIPSLLPILIAGGVMGVMGIYLEFTTVIIAAVVFGIAVDDAIHLTYKYKEGIKRGYGEIEAIEKAVEVSGSAITLTSIILFAGFIVLTLSSFIPNIHFGLLAATIIFSAWLATIFLLPAIVFIGKKEKSEELTGEEAYS